MVLYLGTTAPPSPSHSIATSCKSPPPLSLTRCIPSPSAVVISRSTGGELTCQSFTQDKL
ncbi:hypothetical protein BD626DRAFT_69564 [Schizophyllum amplum]|uniref:Uncharacterized protein n=1 Tax=Schizophyllum amplum TaxID=97359 RepID=A0A550BSC7_9AGAR|nr:hypothetical protein BD626DRAFT_69564 [Auriculariopsis ampla]